MSIIYFVLFGGHAVWLEGSQFPDQGLNPGPLQRKPTILTTRPTGNSL